MDKSKIYSAVRIIISIACIGGLIWLMRGKASELKNVLANADLKWLI
ncbi:MAG: hypothetical protein HY350_05460, partial [Candidatus Omnitrophica bacterium]|nr:hypothetical protein [Candidatus Omnitrophota bacterium]